MRVRFFVAALLLMAACGGDNVLHTCDIREPSCQFDVFLAVQDVRGNLWDPWLEPPLMRVISEAEYRAELIAADEQTLRDVGVDYLTPALQLLHMIDPNEAPSAATDFKVLTVAAYYEATSKRVTIVDHGADQRSDAAQTLAHELVHAAQDRDIGLGRLYQHGTNADSFNALAALVEGEAVLYELLVDAKQKNIPKAGIDWQGLLLRSGIEVRGQTFMDRSPYRVATTQLAYPLGGFYLSQAYTSGGPLALRRMFDHPPLSAARFMADLGAAHDRVPPAWSCNTPQAPPGFQLQIGDELGAFSMYALATRITETEDDAWQLAQQWTGDRFYVYTNPSDASALAVVWQLRMQNPVAAATFQASLARVPWAPGIQTSLDGDTLHIIASSRALEPSYAAWSQCPPL